MGRYVRTKLAKMECVPALSTSNATMGVLWRRIVGQDIETSESAIVTKRLKHPCDPIQLAKLLGDIATGQVKDEEEMTRKAQAVRTGGLRGGEARARKLSPESEGILPRRPLRLDGKFPLASNAEIFEHDVRDNPGFDALHRDKWSYEWIGKLELECAAFPASF
jgi:hypothetical protein